MNNAFGILPGNHDWEHSEAPFKRTILEKRSTPLYGETYTYYCWLISALRAFKYAHLVKYHTCEFEVGGMAPETRRYETRSFLSKILRSVRRIFQRKPSILSKSVFDI